LRIDAELQVEHLAANRLESLKRVVGQLVGEIVDRAASHALRRFADEVAYVGATVASATGERHRHAVDGRPGIAFNAKPVVQEHADAQLSVPYLDRSFFLGISREEIETE